MATARKHWVRAADSILRSKLTMEQRGMLWSLMAWLNQRWARDGLTAKEACRAELNRAALVDITGRTQLKSAVNALRTLGELTSISVSVCGEIVRVDWEKWSEFQQLSRNESPSNSPQSPPKSSPPQDAPAPASARRNTQEEHKSAAARPEPDGSDVLVLNGHRSDKQTKAKQAREAVRKIWPECQAAAAQHGRRWRALSGSRLRKMAARLSEHGPDPNVLVQAIHGAVAYWSKSKPDGDLLVHLTPDTIYSEKFSKYLEAYEARGGEKKRYWDDYTQAEKDEFWRQDALRRGTH